MGGYIYGLYAKDNGFVNFYGNAQAGSVGGEGNGTISMNGGQTEYLHIGYNSIINIYSGTVSDSLNAWDSVVLPIKQQKS
jgi:hypothetical protein